MADGTSGGDHERSNDRRRRDPIKQNDSSALGAHHALDQRHRHAGDDRLGLANLQRLAAVRLRVSALDHARRLARAARCCGTSRRCGCWSINGLVYLTLGIATGRFRRKLFPIRPSEVFSDALAALRGKLSHDDLSVYNAVQKTLYLGVILAGIVIVLSGLVDLEAGAVPGTHRAVRRLRRGALRALLRDGGDRRLSRRACCSSRCWCRKASAP